ncbi:MAG TPA: EF-hand domain-containing protein [Polyangiaceae bacterium]|nr:EF-hand domain-containing protein [Polyangiaceae bacterium]
MRAVVVVLVGLSAAASAGRVHAEPPRRVAKAEPMPELGGRADAAKAEYAEVVGAADADGDARVTGAELEAFVLASVEREVASRFQRLDRNRDGQITRAEVPTMAPARFARFDLNGDGRLVSYELGSVVQRQARSRCRDVFARMDLDRNGVISLDDRDSAETLRVSTQ